MENEGDYYLSSDEESIDGEEIVMEGMRRSRNRTNWLYRGTAMTTTDRMDLESLQWHVFYLQEILAFIGTAFTTLTVIANTRVQQSLPVQRIKNVLDYLCVAVSFITCNIELTYLEIEDRLHFTHTRRSHPAHQNRKISQIVDDNHSENLFGFKINELSLLFIHWRIPGTFRQDNHILDGEASMLIFLFHIRSGMAYTRMSDVFGGDPRLMTYHIRAISDHLYKLFYHKISGDSMRMWTHSIDDCRDAIWNKLQDGIVNERSSNGLLVDWEVWIPPETFRIFGWLDDTDLMTTRPRPARSNEVQEMRDTQITFYK